MAPPAGRPHQRSMQFPNARQQALVTGLTNRAVRPGSRVTAVGPGVADRPRPPATNPSSPTARRSSRPAASLTANRQRRLRITVRKRAISRLNALLTFVTDATSRPTDYTRTAPRAFTSTSTPRTAGTASAPANATGTPSMTSPARCGACRRAARTFSSFVSVCMSCFFPARPRRSRHAAHAHHPGRARERIRRRTSGAGLETPGRVPARRSIRHATCVGSRRPPQGACRRRVRSTARAG